MLFPKFLAKFTATELIAFFLFYTTSFQLAFLQPYLVIIPGERTNLFSGLLCALTLSATCLLIKKGRINPRSPEFLISLVLALLMLMSGLFSLTPFSSSVRGLTVLASGLGGFWCARILLVSESRQKFFLWFSLVVMAGILLVSLICFSYWGNVHRFLDTTPHPLANLILILWFAPLSLLLAQSGPAQIMGGALLALSYLVFYLSDLRSAALIPIFLGVLAVFFRPGRFKYLSLFFIPLLVIIVFFFAKLPKEKLGKEYEPTYYRVENYPFSWHIALKHPLLGIGLRAPRDAFLNDYQMRYPYSTKENFVSSVKRIRTSENIFLTLMAEVGFPFVGLYIFSLFILLTRLVRRVLLPSETSIFPPLALLLPITAALLHFQTFDGLLYPQLSWFFHILLGLIPPNRDQ